MKIIVTESQLRNIVKRQKNKREMKEDDATTASTPTSSSTTSTPLSGEPEGKGADDFPAYPEVDKAEDIVKRGVANPVDYTKKHEDYPEANPIRSRANPIKGM